MIIDTDKLKYKLGDTFWVMAANYPAQIYISSITIKSYYNPGCKNKITSFVEYCMCNGTIYNSEKYLDKLSKTKKELRKQIFNI